MFYITFHVNIHEIENTGNISSVHQYLWKKTLGSTKSDDQNECQDCKFSFYLYEITFNAKGQPSKI